MALKKFSTWLPQKAPIPSSSTVPKEVQEIYDGAQTYHDGKWIMFEPVDTSLFHDFIRLLGIKRKPNRK